MNHGLSGKRPSEWTTVDVSIWLSEIGLPFYSSNFEDLCIDGQILTQDLSKSLLIEDLNVKRIHAPKLVREINTLQEIEREFQSSEKRGRGRKRPPSPPLRSWAKEHSSRSSGMPRSRSPFLGVGALLGDPSGIAHDAPPSPADPLPPPGPRPVLPGVDLGRLPKLQIPDWRRTAHNRSWKRKIAARPDSPLLHDPEDVSDELAQEVSALLSEVDDVLRSDEHDRNSRDRRNDLDFSGGLFQSTAFELDQDLLHASDDQDDVFIFKDRKENDGSDGDDSSSLPNKPPSTSDAQMASVDINWTRSGYETAIKSSPELAAAVPPEQKEEVQKTLPQNYVDCPLCLQLLCEPITAMCGHSFCRICLATALERCKKQCPTCRAVCVLDAKNHPENVTLANVIKFLYPRRYAERYEETKDIKKDWRMALPIFFFNHTLFPTCQLRLRLFEPRYLHMIKRVQSTRMFVYLPNFEDYRAAAGDIGVILHIEECSYLPEDVALVRATAKERIRVTKHWTEEGTQGLCFCNYELVEEDSSNTEELAECWKGVQTSIEQFLSQIDENSQDVLCSDLGPSPDNAINGSFWASALVARIIHNDEFALNMLQLTSTIERLKTCQHILHQVLQSFPD